MMSTLTENTLKALSLHVDVKYLRKEKVTEVEYISSSIDYDEFFLRFLIPNRPCVFGPHVTRGWRSVQEWVTEDGRPNFDFLARNFGTTLVPVADCKKIAYSAQPKSDMQLGAYLQYWQELSQHSTDAQCLYLKDWHFTKSFPDYEAYKTPVFFASDWMNEYWDAKPGKGSDDYRFVYMGPQGSWTPFHADVFRSYSWSANICGRKRWLLYPPGEEDKLRDSLGNLVYDVTSSELHDENKYPHCRDACEPFEVIQGPGEVIFVPSGWHHQVFNIEDTISINHNWLNGCNADITWAFLQQELATVKRSISDCVDMDGWDVQCQIIMKASTGIDYPEFLQLLWAVASSRLHQLNHFKDHSLQCSYTGPSIEFEKADKVINKSLVDSGNCGRSAQSGEVKTSSSTTENPSSRIQDLSYHNPSHSALSMDSTSEGASSCVTDSTRRLLPQQVEDSDKTQNCILSSQKNLPPKPSDIGHTHMWHWIFDLCRIRDILTSLLEDEDFCKIENHMLCKDPHLFLKEIISATRDTV